MWKAGKPGRKNREVECGRRERRGRNLELRKSGTEKEEGSGKKRAGLGFLIS